MAAATLAVQPNSARWVLISAVLGSSLIFTDGTAVNVALPVLQRDLGASFAGVQWVVEGYSLLLSALILIGGSLGDIFGRRLIFGLGIALFTLASVACAAAHSIESLVIARCVQGVGGALATPGSLALITAAYSGAERGRAIGTWSAFSIVVSAVGPVLGGWLVQVASWRWIFLINIPLAAVVLCILVLRVGESRDPQAQRKVDVRGATLATAGLGALVYGLIGLQGGRFDGGALGTIAAGVLLLVAFIAVERRVGAPMIQLDLFDSRPFSIANIYTFLLYAALGGSLYFVPFDLIDVQGYPPAAAGAALLPTTLIMFALSRYSGGLVTRLGPRPLLTGGAALAALAFVIFATTGVGRSYWLSIFPASVLLGLAVASFVAPLTTLVMNAVASTHAGVASGINNAVSRTAGLVAIAVLGIILAAVDPRSVEAGRGHGQSQSAAAHASAARIGYARGFSVVMLVSAALAAAAGLLALDGSLRVVATAGERKAFP